MRESALGRARRAKRAQERTAWRAAVLERDGWHCRLYGVLFDCEGELEAHHVLNRSQGGKDELGNGLTVCQKHHAYITHHREWAYAEGYSLKMPPPNTGLKT